MSYGLELRNAADQVILRVTDPTMRVIYRQYLPAGSSGQVTLQGYNALNARAYVLAYGFPGVAPRAEMIDDGVRWESAPWWPAAYTGAGELVVVAVA